MIRQPYWQIKNVEFTGLEALDGNEIEARIAALLEGENSFFISRRSILLVSSERLEEEMKRIFPRIERIAIDKKFPDTLQIAIHERTFWGIFCGSADEKGMVPCASIDKTGFAYETSPSASGSLIIKIKSDVSDVAVPSVVVEKDLMERLLFLGVEVKRAIGSEVVLYEISSRLPREIRLIVTDGYGLYFNRNDDFQNVFMVLKRVLEQDIKEKRSALEYIDLRFGNKVFYRFRQ